MRLKEKILVCLALLCVFVLPAAYSQNETTPPPLLYGQINSDNINIRADSTVNSQVICVAYRGEPVEIVKEAYEWYKIRLPKNAPSFIRKDFVLPINEKSGKIISDRVNIRLSPDDSSAVLGMSEKNQVIDIIGEEGEWYRIEPLSDTFGWVHKKFVSKAPPAAKEEKALAAEKPSADENITIEGIIRPYGRVFNRIATHKLITADKKTFFLKGNKEGLDSLNYHKVKVTGKLIEPESKKNKVVEIKKIEALD